MDRNYFQTSQVGSALVIFLKGNIGMVELEALDAQLTRIADQKPPFVIMEMSGLSMIGSSAMGSLVGFRRDMTRSGGAVRLAGVPPLVLESFRRAMLDRLFKIFPTVDAAVSADVAAPK